MSAKDTSAGVPQLIFGAGAIGDTEKSPFFYVPAVTRGLSGD